MSKLPSASIRIREFSYPDDYALVIQLWENMEKGVHIGRSDTPNEIEKKLKRDPDLFLVAEADGELVGTAIGGYDGRRGAIYHLAVAASFRGQGISTRLMDEVEAHLRAKGCVRCYLFVMPDNVEAMRYYQKHDWQPMAVHPYAKDLV